MERHVTGAEEAGKVKWSEEEEEETCRRSPKFRQVANKGERNDGGRQSSGSDGTRCKSCEGGWGWVAKSQLAHCPSDGARVFLLQNVQLISSGNLSRRIVSKLINLARTGDSRVSRIEADNE
jgi:hypothetical protein